MIIKNIKVKEDNQRIGEKMVGIDCINEECKNPLCDCDPCDCSEENPCTCCLVWDGE